MKTFGQRVQAALAEWFKGEDVRIEAMKAQSAKRLEAEFAQHEAEIMARIEVDGSFITKARKKQFVQKVMKIYKIKRRDEESLRMRAETQSRIDVATTKMKAEALARLKVDMMRVADVLEAETMANVKAGKLDRISKMESEIAQKERKAMEAEDAISSNMRWLRSCWSGTITSGHNVSVKPVNWAALRDQHAAEAAALQHTIDHDITVDSDKWSKDGKDSETDTDTDGDGNYDMSAGPNQNHPAARASNAVRTTTSGVSVTGSSATPIAGIEWCERARQWCKHASDQDCRRFQVKMRELSYFAARSLGDGVTETNLGRHKKMKGAKNVNLWRTKLDKSYV